MRKVLFLLVGVLPFLTGNAYGKSLSVEITYAGNDGGFYWVISPENQGLGNVALHLYPKEGTPLPKVENEDDGGGGFFDDNEYVMDNIDKVYEPHILIAPKSTPIVISNSDNFYHGVRIETPAGLIPVDLNKVGEEKTVNLKGTGVMKVSCENHVKPVPMEAYIILTDAPFYGLTDWNGKFVFDELAEGKYELKIWHEGLGELTREVTITAHGPNKFQYEYPVGGLKEK